MIGCVSTHHVLLNSLSLRNVPLPNRLQIAKSAQRYGRGFDQNTHFNHLQSPFWWITVPFVIRDFVGTKSCPGYPRLRNPLLSFLQDGLTLHLWWLQPKILTIQLMVE